MIRFQMDLERKSLMVAETALGCLLGSKFVPPYWLVRVTPLTRRTGLVSGLHSEAAAAAAAAAASYHPSPGTGRTDSPSLDVEETSPSF